MSNNQQLDKLTTTITTSSKYKHVSPDLVRALGAVELAKRPSLKTAVKATKNKLHQIGGAYLDGSPNYDKGLALLAANAADPEALRATCCEIMRWHVSTQERLPILDYFYTTTLADLPPIKSIVDLACGLNPLAWLWMPFDSHTTYQAYDIYADGMAFVDAFMGIVGLNGRAAVRDILHNPPTEPVDLAFILKTLPCLEQIDKQAGTHLLDAIQARYLLISYPAASLSGRHKGMVATYDAHFQKLAAGRNWHVQRHLFPTELAFLVTTP